MGRFNLFISPMLEFLRDQFWGQPYSCLLLMIFPMRFYHELGFMQMTPLCIPVLVNLFLQKVESAGELELDLLVHVTFNATKTKLLSFNRHRNPLLVPVEMNGIGLPEETSFRLLGLTFTRSMDWKLYIYSPLSRRLLHGKWASFIGPSLSSLLNPSCICTNLPFGHGWSTVPISGRGGGVPRSHGLDLLDRVQKRVVSLVISGLSSDLQASACATSITMGNVPLSLRISYLPNVSLLKHSLF